MKATDMLTAVLARPRLGGGCALSVECEARLLLGAGRKPERDSRLGAWSGLVAGLLRRLLVCALLCGKTLMQSESTLSEARLLL